MKSFFSLLFCLFFLSFSYTQEERVLLRGKLLYRNNNVVSANVINNSAQLNTITNGDGEFEIFVKIDDELIFSSVQYKIKSVIISKEDIKNNRIVVEVNEKVNFLDEVVIGPENQEKFLDLKEEEFKRVDYLNDKSTKIDNEIIREGKLYNGVNFVNLAKFVSNRFNEENSSDRSFQLIPSEVLPFIFDESFFTDDLKIPNKRILDFLKFIDSDFNENELLIKNQEFHLINYLILKAEFYNKQS